MNELNVHPTPIAAETCANLSVAVLAGGASRRFGTDKAMVRLCPEGLTLLEIVVEAGRSVADEVFVVGHPRYASVVPEFRVVQDDRPGAGPLAAIQTALEAAANPRVLVLACDMPCLSFALLQWMTASVPLCDVWMPRTCDGRWHPMPAIYARAVLPAIRDCLADGQHSVTSLLDRVFVQALPESELRLLDADLGSLFSLNSPDLLDRARQCISCN